MRALAPAAAAAASAPQQLPSAPTPHTPPCRRLPPPLAALAGFQAWATLADATTVQPLDSSQWSLSPEGRTRIPFPLAAFNQSGEWAFSSYAINGAGPGRRTCTVKLVARWAAQGARLWQAAGCCLAVPL